MQTVGPMSCWPQLILAFVKYAGLEFKLILFVHFLKAVRQLIAGTSTDWTFLSRIRGILANPSARKAKIQDLTGSKGDRPFKFRAHLGEAKG